MHDAPSTAAAWPTITDAVVDDIAREADVDRRSVMRRLACLPVRGRSGRRVDAVLERRGLLLVEGR